MVASLLPQIAGDTGVTLVQAGYLVVTYAFAYAIGAPVAAALTGSLDRRTVLTGSTLVFVAGALLAAVSPTYILLLAARLLIAVMAGLYAATAQATAVAISEPHHRARAIAAIVGGTTLAVAFGAPLGAFISAFAGWRGTYYFIALIGALAALVVWFMLPRGLYADRLTIAQRLGVVRHPGLLPALLTMLLYMTGPFAVYTYIAAVAVEGTGLSRSLMPVVLLAFGIGAAIGNFLGGQFSDRFGAAPNRCHSLGSQCCRADVGQLDHEFAGQYRRPEPHCDHGNLGRHRLDVPAGAGKPRSGHRPGKRAACSFAELLSALPRCGVRLDDRRAGHRPYRP